VPLGRVRERHGSGDRGSGCVYPRRIHSGVGRWSGTRRTVESRAVAVYIDADGWAAPEPSAVYHGQVRCQDGQSRWVFPRFHARGGWAVEVRERSRNGPVVERVWQPHRFASQEFVDDLRRQLARSAVDDVLTGSVLPPMPRGILVVHGVQYGTNRVMFGSVDGGPAEPCCTAIWADPGLRTVCWSVAGELGEGRRFERARLEVRLEADTTCHVARLLRTFNRPRNYGGHAPVGHRHRSIDLDPANTEHRHPR
jgi:hypothetical protein